MKSPAALVGLTSTLVFAHAWPWSGPIAMTEHGKVEGIDNHGILTKATVDSFLGIPYAAPPVGDNRLRPPQRFTESWAPKVRAAKKEGHICAQIEIASGLQFGREDCLYLNVFRPSGVESGFDLPVTVYIYGGGFVMGDSEHIAAGLLKMYDPTNIIEKHGNMFVSMNYRLSGFGFMALPELAEETVTRTTGNYGVQDQRAALQWVQRNIRNFGGDPGKVTIQGESAGAMSIIFHLVSPASRGLYRSAIEESGSITEGCYFQNRSDAYEFNREWAAIKGCNMSGPELVSCLRELPASAFMVGASQMVKDWVARLRHHNPLPADIPRHACELFPANAWGTVVDGSSDGLPDFPKKLLADGNFSDVPLIIGTNINEGAMFGWTFPLLWGGWPYPIPHAENMKKIAEWFLRDPADQAKFLKLYAGDDWTTNESIDRVDRFWRDSWTACPALETARYWNSHGQPVYRYVFSFPMHTNITHILHDLTSTHGFELPFVFRNWIGTLGKIFLHPQEYSAMSDVMSCTWASFVRCQKPRCPSDPPPNCGHIDIPEWPAWQSTDRRYISFKVNTTIEEERAESAPYPQDEFPGDDRCDFWKTVDHGWKDIRNPWPTEVSSDANDETLTAMLTQHFRRSALWGAPDHEANVQMVI